MTFKVEQIRAKAKVNQVNVNWKLQQSIHKNDKIKVTSILKLAELKNFEICQVCTLKTVKRNCQKLWNKIEKK